jgi:hypothetical protein
LESKEKIELAEQARYNETAYENAVKMPVGPHYAVEPLAPEQNGPLQQQMGQH